ncbi:GFA family protein [Thalassorhabdomicrobium marinisediminis]|uniref:GFA family protein n=1 Tax=Thalassorhabdomicrobium marinisediminis TaxID=2170577 RepID=UPI002491ACE4|nr:GFA family protein [Thalassorhabdomicrobium marinisediminis]
MTILTGGCLCGAVTFTHAAPKKLVRCNCAACRRYGALWAHGPLDAIRIRANGPLIRYTRADLDGPEDGGLVFVSCATCGVTTHWEPATPQGDAPYMAVNGALAEPDVQAALPLRHFDGADSWSFTD